MTKLVLTHEGVNLRTYELDKDELTIGRKTDNDIQLDDAAVSSSHAVIRVSESDYLEGHKDVTLEDLGSTNGTFVNGMNTQKILLKHGDVIRIGKHQFTFDSGQVADLAATAIYIPEN